MTELFITDGPYDPGAITLADAANVMASTMPDGSFRQALRTFAARIQELEGEVERLTADNGYARDDIGRLYDVVWRLTKHHGTACKTRQSMTAPRCASPCDQCDIDDAAMVAIGAGILHFGQKDATL